MAPRKLQVLFTSTTGLVTWLPPDNDQGNLGTVFPEYTWSAVALQWNAGLAIERARVRILFATVSKFGYFSSLHDAPVHSAV